MEGAHRFIGWRERQGVIASDVDDKLKDLRILLVEDEFLLACSLEEDLRSVGARTVGTFSRLAAALEGARNEPFDLAILDVNLSGEMVYPLADELASRNIPFILLTGYIATQLPERFRTSPRIAKPYDSACLLREIRKLLPAIHRTAPIHEAAVNGH